MAVFFVRHAKAGSRSEWTDDDMIRPLSKKGWKQAHALAQIFAPHSPSALISSPYLRCIQTLEPLSQAISHQIEIHDALTEGAAFEDTLALLNSVPNNAVLCSHGDVIPAAIDALLRRGMHIIGEPDTRKAATFVLHRTSDVFTTSECWAPPSV